MFYEDAQGTIAQWALRKKLCTPFLIITSQHVFFCCRLNHLSLAVDLIGFGSKSETQTVAMGNKLNILESRS